MEKDWNMTRNRYGEKEQKEVSVLGKHKILINKKINIFTTYNLHFLVF